MAGPEPSVINPWVLLVALGVVIALLVAPWGEDPFFLVAPPITRRSKAYELPHSQDCLDGIQEGAWDRRFLPISCSDPNYATCGEVAMRRWRFSARALECGAKLYNRSMTQTLLGGKWVMFAGDSITRHLYAALLRLSGSKGQEVKLKHSDFEYVFDGNIKATFLWRPFPSNLTAQFEAWKIEHNASRPAVIVSAVGLWHLLYVTSGEVYGKDLEDLAVAAADYLQVQDEGARPLLLLGATTETYTNLQPTAAKRKAMTPKNVDSYNEAMIKRGVVGNTKPFALLDLFALTEGCGEECSTDGVHSRQVVYDTALQLILNMHSLGRS